jgi:putative inorganic carbon (HCO3(-)) transporter
VFHTGNLNPATHQPEAQVVPEPLLQVTEGRQYTPEKRLGFALYLVFIASFLLHLPARIHVLGAIRFDLLLMAVISILVFMEGGVALLRERGGTTGKILAILILYILFSLPFVTWPGSVIHTNLPEFLKAVVFFFFTVLLVNSEARLRTFLVVFVACQVFRVLEPLYDHLTVGYWGSATNMGSGEFMARLAGSRYDTINPNGLAYVIVSTIPFLHYLASSASWKVRFLYWTILPVLLYALVLTASRSGFVALLVIAVAIFIKSSSKPLYAVIFIVGILVAASVLTPIQKDRYLSLIRTDVAGASTVEGRIEGVKRDFAVAMRRPFFGHGLGTSREANFNERGANQLSHNLYTEVLQELGLFGFVIFLCYIVSIFRNFRRVLQTAGARLPADSFLLNVTHAMEVWLWMNVIFSFASYGLSGEPWYLFGGLSAVLLRVAAAATTTDNERTSHA